MMLTASGKLLAVSVVPSTGSTAMSHSGPDPGQNPTQDTRSARTLCRLTATPISSFFREPSDLRASETTPVYHLPAKVLRELDRTPVTAFTREAIAATLAGRNTP